MKSHEEKSVNYQLIKDLNSGKEIGNKAANLVVLNSMLLGKHFGFQKKISVQIPQICPLKHGDVFEHLTRFENNFPEMLLQFQRAQGSEETYLTEQAKKILEKLREIILNAFNEHHFTSK